MEPAFCRMAGSRPTAGQLSLIRRSSDREAAAPTPSVTWLRDVRWSQVVIATDDMATGQRVID